MVWYGPQRKVISRATNTEKRCILRNKLIPYLILLAYKGSSYEKVTTSLRSHLHDSYISDMKGCIYIKSTSVPRNTCSHWEDHFWFKVRARHWCLPHCPGQVELVNYSCGASENCILLAPLGKNILYISGLLLWSAIQACPRKYAFTCQNHVLIGFKWNIINLLYTIFQGQVKVGVGQVKIESHLPYGASRCKS